MAKLSIVGGTTSKSLRLFVQNSSVTTGAGLTGLVSTSSGLIAYYIREGASTTTSISLTTQTLGTWTSGGFVAVDGTNMPGLYEFGVPNAAFASGSASVVIMLSGAANMVPCVSEVELTAVNNQSTGFGLVNASSNVVQWNGSNVSAPATAGIPDINVKNMNNVAATSITTINANQGTTQPVNFTGSTTNALVKSDMQDIAGAAVATGTAQIGVNLVNITGSAVSTTTAQLGVNAVNIGGSISSTATIGTVINLTNAATAGDFTSTMKTSLNAATPASVTGAVGSVTGNVGGNVVGSVGSVVGAVGSVTGNVGGNVTGSVGSVVAAVGITSNRKKGSTATFKFTMQDSTTGADKTGLTVASVISKDSGAFTSTANAVTEIGDGWYQLVLTGTEMTANNVSLQMTATGATARDLSIQTQP